MNGRGTYDIQGFRTAYDEVMAKWPADREAFDVATRYGTTHVNACGPRDAPPLVLLPGGGGATSASWFANAEAFSRSHRVYAVDLIGEPGRSTREADHPLRTVADLTAWMDLLLDGLGVGATALCGHSYGAWIALHCTLHAPDRVRRLALLDPTGCFTGFAAGYLVRAAWMMARRSARGTRAFLEWETGGGPVDPEWLRLQEAAADFPFVRPVTGPAPDRAASSALDVPALLLLAGRSRAHDTRKVAARSVEWLPRARVTVLPDATHHALPHRDPAELNSRLTDFLNGR
ncbi:alpha/beta fold hydrolase [Streptomyces sp. KM273126]|uniref:alpha/beta fold hydrolase n=1 Tax=Streptomyces sp. KM273126 TaxID=2545247 RepID=UPI00103FE189|nr:alpha/beta fold hydrolase [Streptomyces sp. KM273126]MBA2811798.1 alpha/beta fold hydrolase [Streptomyces sp. KM273126]